MTDVVAPAPELAGPDHPRGWHGHRVGIEYALRLGTW